MHLQGGLHFVWQFILLTKHISSHISSQSVDKCMLSNTLFPAFDEKYTVFKFPGFSMGGALEMISICCDLARGV